MSNLIINCPHCDRPTPVELGKRVTSKQRCKHCGVNVGESDIVVGGRKPVVRKRVTVQGREFTGEQDADDTSGWEGKRPRKARVRLPHIVGMLVILGLGVWGIVKVMIKSHENSVANNAPTQQGPSAQEAQDARQFDGTKQLPTSMVSPETTQRISEMFELIRTIEDPEEFLPLVRKPEETKEKLLQYYNEGRYELPIGDRLKMGDGTRIDYDESLKIIIYYATDENDSIWWVVFEETDDGPKLDWETFARYSDEDPLKYLEEKPEGPKTFRVLGMIDDYFNYKYDFSYWCVRLFDPEDSFGFYGYVKRDTPLGKKIRAAIPAKHIRMSDMTFSESGNTTDLDGLAPLELSNPGLARPRALVTLKVQFPEPLQGNNQVEIVDLVRKSWYVP